MYGIVHKSKEENLEGIHTYAGGFLPVSCDWLVFEIEVAGFFLYAYRKSVKTKNVLNN